MDNPRFMGFSFNAQIVINGIREKKMEFKSNQSKSEVTPTILAIGLSKIRIITASSIIGLDSITIIL